MYIAGIRNVYNLQSLTASEEVTTFEVGKLQSPFGTTRWRSTSTTPYIVGQFDESRTVQAWGPLYSNAQSGDTVRLRTADSQANLTASPDYDSTAVSVWPGTADLTTWLDSVGYVHSRLTVPTASQISSAWFRIDFNYSANTDGYVEVGGLAIDTMHQPASGHQMGWKYLPTTQGMFINQTGSGGESRGQGTEKRSISFELNYQTEADAWGQMNNTFRYLGNRLPVLVVLRESEDSYPMDYIYYGCMEYEQRGLRDKQAFAIQVQIIEP